jgi:DNA-binding response OmpR family regulator
LTATRQAGKGLPILILTARDAVEDRVAGLNAGRRLSDQTFRDGRAGCSH